MKTYNYAEVGASVKHSIFRMFNAVNESKINSGDLVFFQLSPWPREIFMHEQHIVSIQIAVPENKPPDIKNYIKNKILSHSRHQFAVEDLMDILLLNGYLKSLDINLILIDLDSFLKSRVDTIPIYYKFLANMLIQNIKVIDLKRHLLPLYVGNRLSGGHYNQRAHVAIAEELKKHIDQLGSE